VFNYRRSSALFLPDVVQLDVYGGRPAVRHVGRGLRGGTIASSLLLHSRLRHVISSSFIAFQFIDPLVLLLIAQPLEGQGLLCHWENYDTARKLPIR